MPINCTDCVALTGQSSPQQPCLFWFLLIPGTGVTSNEQALRRIPSLGWRAELQQPLTPFRQNSSHCQLRRMRGDTRRVGAWFGLKLCQCTACRVQHPSDGRLSADCSAAQRFEKTAGIKSINLQSIPVPLFFYGYTHLDIVDFVPKNCWGNHDITPVLLFTIYILSIEND